MAVAGGCCSCLPRLFEGWTIIATLLGRRATATGGAHMCGTGRPLLVLLPPIPPSASFRRSQHCTAPVPTGSAHVLGHEQCCTRGTTAAWAENQQHSKETGERSCSGPSRGVVRPIGQPQAPAVQREGRVGGKGQRADRLLRASGRKGPLQSAHCRLSERTGCIGQIGCKASTAGL